MSAKFKSLVGFGLILSLNSMARASEEPPTAGELAAQLRGARGLSAGEAALVGLTGEQYGQVVSAAETFVTANRQAIEPLLNAVAVARKNVVLAYEQNSEDIGEKEQLLLAATSALESASAAMLASAHAAMGTESTSKHARLGQNRLLDPSVALLDLTDPQKTAVRAAQRDRDRVLRHHRDRKNPHAVKQALDSYETAIQATLTEPQRTERQQLIAAASTHLPAILAAESASSPE